MPFHRAIPQSKTPAQGSSLLAGYIGLEMLMNLAFVMLAAFLICFAAGWWVDHHFHQHWGTVTGALLGCVAGLYTVIQQAIAAERISRKADLAQSESARKSGAEKA